MKIILDTNIWISGLLIPTSKAGTVLNAWRAAKFDIVTSEPILNEIQKVLLYPKIKKRLQWNAFQVEEYLLHLKFFTQLVNIEHPNNHSFSIRDPNDLMILETWNASHADHIVTGDIDLLVLQDQYPILTLTDFFNML